jgi:hypothetical protein
MSDGDGSSDGRTASESDDDQAPVVSVALAWLALEGSRSSRSLHRDRLVLRRNACGLTRIQDERSISLQVGDSHSASDARDEALSVWLESDHGGCLLRDRGGPHHVVADPQGDSGSSGERVRHGRTSEQYGGVTGIPAEDDVSPGINLYSSLAGNREGGGSSFVGIDGVGDERRGLRRGRNAVYLDHSRGDQQTQRFAMLDLPLLSVGREHERRQQHRKQDQASKGDFRNGCCH